MKKLIALFLILSLCLSGCGWMDGNYVHISQHQEKRPSSQGGSVTVSNFAELQEVMTRMVENGVRNNVIFLSDYDQSLAGNGMTSIKLDMLSVNPLGSYVLKDIDFEVGMRSGKPAIAVEMEYRRTNSEIRQVRRYKGTREVRQALAEALDEVRPGIVMLIREYEDLDFVQMVNDYAQANPQKVMEIPQVTESKYGVGESRLVELVFTYQTSRETLRQMRHQVEPIFEAAKLYVSKGASDYQKYNQLYSFLMERYDYELQSSITPTYSLLNHGVGDYRAFATIYAAMCRSVGLPCQVVIGTRDGQPWAWNLIVNSNYYVHLDLLRCSEEGKFRAHPAHEMEGYVWDYSAVPTMTPQVPPAAVHQSPT